jgi:hypothetical protein
MNLDKLKDPFPASDIEWRIGRAGKNNRGIWAMCLAYVTNRAIMERLDAAVGPENWRNEYREGPGGGVLCGISIRVGDEWVTKWDGAENTDVEGVKGGLSGAMKRAGYQWGIGRYLYKLDEGFATISPNGANFARLPQKEGGDSFKWDPPALPAWALPNGESAPAPAPRAAPAPAPAPTANPQSAPQEDVPCPDCQGKTWDNREGKKNPKAPDFKCRDKECEGVWWPGEWDEQNKRLDYIRQNWKAIPDTTTVELDGATVRLKPYIKDAADGIKANKELAKLIADTVDGIVSQGTLDGAA